MAISQSLYNCLRTKTADLVGGFLGNRLRTNVEGQGRAGVRDTLLGSKRKRVL